MNLAPTDLNKSSIPCPFFADVNLKYAPISLANTLASASSTSSCSDDRSDLFPTMLMTKLYSIYYTYILRSIIMNLIVPVFL